MIELLMLVGLMVGAYGVGHDLTAWLAMWLDDHVEELGNER